MKSALILYPNQLFPLDELPAVDSVLMVEDPLFFGIDRDKPIRLHKQKLILHRASMRRYVEEVLWPADIKVDYISLDGLMTSEDIFERARKFDQLYVFDPIDETLTRKLLEARRSDNSVAAFEFLASPNFYLKNHEIQSYFADKSAHMFDEFYQWQRERFNILIDSDYKPTGGKWMLEPADDKKGGDGQVPPTFEVFGSNKYVQEAIKFVEEHFPDNPGSTDFVWPTNFQEAEAWLTDFVENRLDCFAPYNEMIDRNGLWLYHSALSSSLNVGLLSPTKVVDAALARHKKKPVPIESLELFIRGVLGHREFIRAQYLSISASTRKMNYFGHKRRMTTEWFHGGLGLPPYDDLINKVQGHGYVHGVERAEVAVNLMLLSEIEPVQINSWFNSLFIDAYEWVTSPNVYRMVQFIEDSSNEKICIHPSDYIISISNYEKGDWCDTWDGLFWRFVEKHADKLRSHKETSGLIKQLEKLDPDHRRIIGYRAEDFLNKFTK